MFHNHRKYRRLMTRKESRQDGVAVRKRGQSVLVTSSETKV